LEQRVFLPVLDAHGGLDERRRVLWLGREHVIEYRVAARRAAEVAAVLKPARAVGAAATRGRHHLEWHEDDLLPAPTTEVRKVELDAAAHVSIVENFELGLRKIAWHAA